MTKIIQEDGLEAGAKTDELKEKIANFSRKYVSEILSYNFFNAIPRLNELFREHQLTAIEMENKALEQSRRKELEETEDLVSEPSQEYSYEEENENNILAAISDWDFPKIIGRIPEYENGVLELIKVLE
jgi:hypothetical protein